MYRNRLILFLSIGLSIFLCLPIVNLALRVGLDVHPVIPEEPKQLWSLDLVEGGASLALWRCCERSTRPGKVIIGKSGYLFLGNKHEDVVDKTTGSYTISETAAEAWSASLAQIASLVETSGASFVFSVAPNKHTIYPEFLPDGEIASKETLTDQLFSTASIKTVTAIDLRAPLKKLKSEKPLYLQTDSHWNNAGAALAYTETMNVLAADGLELTQIPFQLREIRHEAGGLSKLLKLGNLLSPEHETEFAFDYEASALCESRIDLISGVASACDPQKNAVIDVPRGNAFFRMTRAEKAPNAQTVLMLCDSFCTAHSELFNASFKAVYRIHWSQVLGARMAETLERFKPDIVIYQTVERVVFLHDLSLN
jgi:alginate O-acetyltransferase complex protein AlgJ